jgi:8-oxo-dGTP pyrophosphatase MutT (NUDIX family)
MKQVEAAGGVVIVEAPFPGVVLVVHGDPPELRLPKGLIEIGESPQVAALREVLEETGVRGSIGDEIGKASWPYVYDGVPMVKEVTFFLIENPVWTVVDDDPDVRGLIIVDLAVAQELMTFDEERRIVQLALETSKIGR